MLKMRMAVTRWVWTGAFALLTTALNGTVLAGAQGGPSEPAPSPGVESRPETIVDRDSPRGAVEGFLDAEFTPERQPAINCVDSERFLIIK